jgi:Superinfection immunity protein
MDDSLGLILLLLVLYFAPAAVAWLRYHPHTAVIFVLNLLLGWTLLGWAGAMVWAWRTAPKAPPEDVAMTLEPLQSPVPPRRRRPPPVSTPLSPAQRRTLLKAMSHVARRGNHAPRPSRDQRQP